MGIPMYGQEKQGNALDAISQFKKVHTVFDIYVDADSPDDNADTGITVPAGAIVTGCVVCNIGGTALDSGAKTLDLGGTDLTASLASLAANACVGMDATMTPVRTIAAANILVDGNIYTASGNTTLRVTLEYYAPEEHSDIPVVKFSGGAS
jgi:hypothetical protein|tara:strand:- start:16 stop:468 length:453 start_codon:yes stop_codon:yes gene_type:complete